MRRAMAVLVKEEAGLLFGLLTLVCFLAFGRGWLTNLFGTILPTLLFCWLFLTMLWLSFGVVRHADCLAIRLGEPYGTLILTIAVISIEVVMITAVMLTGSQNPTLGRDMMFAVLMIVLNGLIGISLFCGGLRHLEQAHNLQGANTFLVVLIPLAVFSLFLPNFTISTEAGTYSTLQMIFGILASVALYGTFLAIQTMRHQGFFRISGDDLEEGHGHGMLTVRSVTYHVFLLLFTMLPIVLLSKRMAGIIDYTIAALDFPVALGGVLIAVLVLAPEGVAAIKAAVSDRLQRSVNICLGSALATIGLTVPAVLLISLYTGNRLILGLEPVESVLLVSTLAVSIMTFSSSKTNIIHGMVHLILFCAYLVMIFD
ncbi:calcium:proton antiporter [Desulfotalea psychrophila]|uniref:Probable calcium/proton antiporter n=1 Tax=Desulfotalea psychrophila (strain LSv54 / DSM 12343) TaxID=177439 RepID=Q6ARR3_DESPS|nr:calcium:proton antiporter [Desulfotalea psychrophila]CAG34962.1 probable calcium/proton antiporter [Desulfotalea psychrophila LSv54]